jgi:hypothetical protein
MLYTALNNNKKIYMKQIITIIIFLMATIVGFAQGKSKEKTKDKQKTDKTVQTTNGNNNQNTANTQQNGNSKLRKNIPTKVGSSFAGEYPNAVNATWLYLVMAYGVQLPLITAMAIVLIPERPWQENRRHARY